MATTTYVDPDGNELWLREDVELISDEGDVIVREYRAFGDEVVRSRLFQVEGVEEKIGCADGPHRVIQVRELR